MINALYVHIPFCDHICAYCDFCKVIYKTQWADDYLKALAKEIDAKSIHHSFKTIYIGGGTPSSLTYIQLKKLLEMLKPYSLNTEEYSIEVNPESMTEDKVELLKQYGVNRVSIGVQTFHEHVLKTISRQHTKSQVLELIELLKKHDIYNINVDLIYGLPESTLEDTLTDIDILNSYQIPHISVYALILEDHTVLNHLHYIPLSAEEDYRYYAAINSRMKELGYNHYEVSNYTKGSPSIHNLTYWNYDEYLGIGLGAHSRYESTYIENTRSLQNYLQGDYVLDSNLLDIKEQKFENIMMSLRLKEGLDIEKFNERYHTDFLTEYQSVIEQYIQLDLLKIKNNHLLCTYKGLNLMDSILLDFLE